MRNRWAALAFLPWLLAASFPSTTGTVTPGTVLEDGQTGNRLFKKNTYRYSQTTASFAVTFTDVWVVSGSASKTVAVNSIRLCATTSSAGTLDVFLVKRSTADTAGTSTSITAIPADSANTAVSGTVLNYTANPTLGTAVGQLGVTKLNTGAGAGVGQCISWTFGPPGFGQPVTLRGVAQQLAVNFNGAAVPAGLGLDIEIETTEE